MKILPVGAELFQTDGRTDRHDEANIRFSPFCEKRLKTEHPLGRLLLQKQHFLRLTVSSQSSSCSLQHGTSLCISRTANY